MSCESHAGVLDFRPECVLRVSFFLPFLSTRDTKHFDETGADNSFASPGREAAVRCQEKKETPKVPLEPD